MDVTFRRLVDADIPLLHGWLNDPEVIRWWEGDDVSLETVTREYGTDSAWPSVEHHLVVVDGEPAGWIQCYPAEEDPEETESWVGLGIAVERTGAIDYLLGSASVRGRGVGPLMLAAFAQLVLDTHPEWDTVAASPYLGNRPSWTALARAGFTHVGDIAHDGPGGDGTDRDDGPLRLMAMHREG